MRNVHAGDNALCGLGRVTELDASMTARGTVACLLWAIWMQSTQLAQWAVTLAGLPTDDRRGTTTSDHHGEMRTWKFVVRLPETQEKFDPCNSTFKPCFALLMSPLLLHTISSGVLHTLRNCFPNPGANPPTFRICLYEFMSRAS